DLVSLPAVRRAGRAADGPGQHGGAARQARTGDREVVPRDARAEPAGVAAAQVELQRGPRRAGRRAGARRQRDAALLHERRGQGGQGGLPRAPQARLQAVQEAAVSVKAWLLAARPKTLTAAAIPVAVGSAAAARAGHFVPLTAAAALFGALFIQI